MQERFAKSIYRSPGSDGKSIMSFLSLCYILARIFFGQVKRHLPYFRGMHRMLRAYDQKGI